MVRSYLRFLLGGSGRKDDRLAEFPEKNWAEERPRGLFLSILGKENESLMIMLSINIPEFELIGKSYRFVSVKTSPQFCGMLRNSIF
jgi:hypothetical protein